MMKNATPVISNLHTEILPARHRLTPHSSFLKAVLTSRHTTRIASGSQSSRYLLNLYFLKAVTIQYAIFLTQQITGYLHLKCTAIKTPIPEFALPALLDPKQPQLPVLINKSFFENNIECILADYIAQIFAVYMRAWSYPATCRNCQGP